MLTIWVTGIILTFIIQAAYDTDFEAYYTNPFLYYIMPFLWPVLLFVYIKKRLKNDD